MGDHRIGVCAKCDRDDVEIAAHGLCYVCYRAERRALERGGAGLQRSLNRQPADLIREYRALMLAVAVIDSSETGGSGLAGWVAERVEPLTEPIRPYIATQSYVSSMDNPPDPVKRFRAYHEVSIRLLRLGATDEMIAEIQERLKLRMDAVDQSGEQPKPKPPASRKPLKIVTRRKPPDGVQ